MTGREKRPHNAWRKVAGMDGSSDECCQKEVLPESSGMLVKMQIYAPLLSKVLIPGKFEKTERRFWKSDKILELGALGNS